MNPFHPSLAPFPPCWDFSHGVFLALHHQGGGRAGEEGGVCNEKVEETKKARVVVPSHGWFFFFFFFFCWLRPRVFGPGVEDE